MRTTTARFSRRRSDETTVTPSVSEAPGWRVRQRATELADRSDPLRNLLRGDSCRRRHAAPLHLCRLHERDAAEDHDHRSDRYDRQLLLQHEPAEEYGDGGIDVRVERELRRRQMRGGEEVGRAHG